MSLTGGQALVSQLQREGVEHVFGIPGLQLDWAVEALRQAQETIQFIVPRHEQTASYMADGYARTTGREGVSMVVPGPGVLNALSGLATAYACSSRTLFIAGQIPSPTIGRGHGMLHEIPDQSAILKTLTKWHAVARSADEVADLVNQAFHELRSGHPRPVALEIPPDVLEAMTDAPLQSRAAPRAAEIKPEDLAEAAMLLSQSKFPVIQIGGGAAAADVGPAVAQLAERLQAPVIMTDGGRGVLPDSHPLALTGLGGRAVLPHADVVLVLGSRFLDALARPTWTNPRCRFIYVNLDPRHVGEPRQPGVGVAADVAAVLPILNAAMASLPARPARAQTVAKVKVWCDQQIRRIQPQKGYVDALRAAMPADGVLVSELTQVGYFANVAYPVEAPGSYLTPGYQGTLGYGFPTALGAAAGNPHRRVVSITGDGGFGWGMQELATAARYRLGVTTVVFSDGRYGNVQRIQQRTFGHTFATEVANPDFLALAAAFGVPARRANSPDELAEALSWSGSSPGPSLIEVPVGEMPSPWPLIHAFVPSDAPLPNPLGDPEMAMEPIV